MDGVTLLGLELGADGLTKPLQGQAFNRFLSLIGMMDETDASISKVVVPLPSSSSTASSGFNKALAVMGVGHSWNLSGWCLVAWLWW
jgi:hypothetical protein